jgi:hypothetical protein
MGVCVCVCGCVMGTKSERGWGLIRATKEKGEKRKKKEQKKWRGSCWAAIRRERGKEAKKKKRKERGREVGGTRVSV